MASVAKKVVVSEEDSGNKVNWKYRIRMTDPKQLVEMAKAKEKKKTLYTFIHFLGKRSNVRIF